MEISNMNLFVKLATLLCYATLAYSTQDVETTTMENVVSTTSGPTEDSFVEKAVNQFGFKLIKSMMKQDNGTNIVVSPTGIVGILAMTLLGSAGATYDELADTIGFTKDILTNRKYHEDFGTRLHTLKANDTKTLYANAVFVDGRSALREVYRAYLQRVYHGEALQADFGHNGDEARQMINEWVSNHTNSKLNDFLQNPLPASTKVVLLSALYFSGQWAEPFLPEYTRQLTFNTPTKEVQADSMFNYGKFRVITSVEDHLQMIALPYNDSVTTMYVIKPIFPRRMNITQLLDRLTYDKIDNLITQMQSTTCYIRLPKLDLENKVDLKESLRILGVRTMFTPDAANFAVMLESEDKGEEEVINRINAGHVEARTLKDMVNKLVNPKVHVDAVIHEVKMTVDEYGTEAVAASGAFMSRSAFMFYVDTPFYLFIRNERTKLVTFSAVVVDPTLK